MSPLTRLDRLLRESFGAGLLPVAIGTALLSAVGATVGFLFPKYEAVALLQFPEPARQAERLELSAYKRVAASYASPTQLRAYVESAGLQQSAAAARLLGQAERSSFWDRAASPVLPFTRRDQREFGDIKDAAANVLLGLDLAADARSPELASQMIDVLAAYFTNAVVRERIRSWVLAGRADSVGAAKALQADIVRAELDIQLLERRAQDMKAILSRYPDAARMDARQVVSVNPNEGGERFLSPLAQLVGFESAISQRREQIRRWERELKQKQLLAGFFDAAEQAVNTTTTLDQLLLALQKLGAKSFAEADPAQEWVKEATLRVNGALDNFAVMRDQFGVRNGIRVTEVAMRTPARLALLLFLLGIVAVAGVAFLRASLRAARGDEART